MLDNIEIGVYVAVCVLVVLLITKHFVPEFSI